jgi:hypothetical protein
MCEIQEHALRGTHEFYRDYWVAYMVSRTTGRLARSMCSIRINGDAIFQEAYKSSKICDRLHV